MIRSVQLALFGGGGVGVGVGVGDVNSISIAA